MQCQYIKANNSQCNSNAMKGSKYCYFHNPEIENKEKKAAQSKGGRSLQLVNKTSLEPIQIKKSEDVVSLLEDTINRVRAGEMDVRIGNCIGVLSGQMIKALEISQIQTRVEIIERAILEKRIIS